MLGGRLANADRSPIGATGDAQEHDALSRGEVRGDGFGRGGGHAFDTSLRTGARSIISLIERTPQPLLAQAWSRAVAGFLDQPTGPKHPRSRQFYLTTQIVFFGFSGGNKGWCTRDSSANGPNAFR